MMRLYANDTVAVSNTYNDLAFIDRAGQVSRIPSRITVVLVNMDGRWKIVEQHVSQMPTH
jgi:ketosteroid isomerase-like protein